MRIGPSYAVVSYAHLRRNLSRMLKRVVIKHEVIIVQQKGAEDVAFIPAEGLAGEMETEYLLRSPRNARRLLAALKRANSNATKRKPQRSQK